MPLSDYLTHQFNNLATFLPLSCFMAFRLCCVEPLEFLNALQGLTGTWDLAQPPQQTPQQSLLFFIYWGFTKDCGLKRVHLGNSCSLLSTVASQIMFSWVGTQVLHAPGKHPSPSLKDAWIWNEVLISSALIAEPTSDSFSSSSLAEIHGENRTVDMRKLSPSALSSLLAFDSLQLSLSMVPHQPLQVSERKCLRPLV